MSYGICPSSDGRHLSISSSFFPLKTSTDLVAFALLCIQMRISFPTFYVIYMQSLLIVCSSTSNEVDRGLLHSWCFSLRLCKGEKLIFLGYVINMLKWKEVSNWTLLHKLSEFSYIFQQIILLTGGWQHMQLWRGGEERNLCETKEGRCHSLLESSESPILIASI